MEIITNAIQGAMRNLDEATECSEHTNSCLFMQAISAVQQNLNAVRRAVTVINSTDGKQSLSFEQVIQEIDDNNEGLGVQSLLSKIEERSFRLLSYRAQAKQEDNLGFAPGF